MTTLIPQFDLKNGGATPTGAVNRPINEKLAEWVSVLDFGAVGDGVVDDSTAVQNAINFVSNGTLYFPKGTYLVKDLSIIGKYICLVGEGMKTSELKAAPSATYIVNAGDTSDVAAAQFQIDNLSLNGNSVANVIGLNASYRHKWEISNSIISNCKYGIYEANTYLGIKSNCYFINNTYGLYLAGANHNSSHNNCTFTSSNYGVWITTFSSGDQSNINLTFNNCDFEYNNASSYGVYVNTPNIVYFNECYFEETANAQTCIFMNKGSAIVSGGWINPSAEANSYFVNLSSGTLVTVNNAYVLVNDTTKLMYSTGGAITYNNCSASAIPTVLTPQFNLQPVGFNNTIYNLVAPTGKQWISETVNGATITSSISGTSQTITCTNAGTSGAIGLYSNLDQSYSPSNNLYFCITYSTNSANFKLYLATSHFAGTQTVYSLPNTSGAMQTALVLNTTFNSSNSLIYAELANAALSVNDTFTLYNVKLADYRYRTNSLLNISL